MSLSPPTHIKQNHWDEWVKGSGVHPGITALNVVSLLGSLIYDYLFYSPAIKRRNTGRVVDSYLQRYRLLENGGWWCGGGIDPLDWTQMLWGQFKPDTPRASTSKGKDFKGFSALFKLVKYEPPPATDLRAYFLRVPQEIWDKIALRFTPQSDRLLTLQPENRHEPTDFWEWVFLHPEVPIIITEGAKKAGALLSAGHVAIALPGISCGFRSHRDANGEVLERRLIPELEKFVSSGREIYFCFDNDPKPSTKAAVERAIQTTGGLFAALECQVKVISWVSDQKGVDDFLVANGTVAFEAIYRKAVSLEAYTSLLLWKLTFPASLTLNQRYLEELPFPLSGFVCVKSPKGTGKTQALEHLVASSQGEGRKVLVITHRIQLGRAICDRLGLDWVDELPDSVTQGMFGFGICIDSVHPLSAAHFDPQEWAGAIVVLDEVEQVTWHLLNSSTCYEKRVSILETFSELLGVVAATGGLIIAQDADLSDLSINFIRGLVKRQVGLDLLPWVVVNNWLDPETCWDVTLYNSSSAAPLLSQIERSLSSGGAVIIHCDGQKASSKWGTKNLESWCHKNFPTLTCLRIDSETVADPTHPAYGGIEAINTLVKNYRIIIASPSIGTGVSIDVREHFQAVFLIAQGVCPESEMRQALARVRDPVPRYIWARSYGLSKIGNGRSNYKELLASTFKIAQVNIRLLRDFDFDIDAATDPIATSTWAKMASRINASSWQFRNALHHSLVGEGHRVTLIDPLNAQKDQEHSDQLSSCCELNQAKENQAVEAVAMPTEPQYRELKDKRSKTIEDLFRVKKYQLHQRYGIEVTADLKQKDDDDWYQKIRLHYLLTHDPEFLQQRDRQHFAGHLERGSGQVCLWDLQGYLPKVEALKFLNLAQWFDPERQLSSHDPDLIAWSDSLKKFAPGLRDLGLGSFNHKLSPIQCLHILLSQLGMKLEKTQRCRVKGVPNALQFYRYSDVDDGRAVVFAGWEQRDSEALAIATPPPTGLQESATPGSAPISQICVIPEYINTGTTGWHTTESKQAQEGQEAKPDGVSQDLAVKRVATGLTAQS